MWSQFNQQPAQTAQPYQAASQSGSYMTTTAPSATGTVETDSGGRRGNNQWGSAGTWKCQACRGRHKRCVLIPGTNTCVHCDKTGKPCQLEWAPKQQKNANDFRSVEMSNTSSQDCDVSLSDIVRQAERQFPGYGLYEMLAIVADTMGCVTSFKSQSAQEPAPTQPTTYNQPSTSTTTASYPPVNPYSMYPPQPDNSAQYMYTQPTPMNYGYGSTSAAGGTTQYYTAQ